MPTDALFVPFNAGKTRGRPRKYTPMQLLKEFEVYVNDRMTRPLEIVETEKGRIGNSVIDKTKTKTIPHPLSIRDFCVHLGVGETWFRQLPDDFSSVKAHIQGFLEDYQVKGAMTGIYNANIVARLIGLKERTELSTENGTAIIVDNREQRDRINNIGELGV